jgi:hypothetical protein
MTDLLARALPDKQDLPGGASGLLCRDYKGKRADRLVTRIDPGVVSLIAELRGHEHQAARELDQWNTSHEEPEPLDASPAARALEMERQTLESDVIDVRGPGTCDRPTRAWSRWSPNCAATAPTASSRKTWRNSVWRRRLGR